MSLTNNRFGKLIIVGTALLPVFSAAIGLPRDNQKRIEFNRDIRPILSENCFACHGPDEGARKAKLRLDTQAGAWQVAILPGQPSKSPLVARLNAPGDAGRMPPVAFGKTLKPQQIALLTEWVKQGGKYDKHWAFVPPKRYAIPTLTPADKKWTRNPIDAFVLQRLTKAGMKPSPEADRRTLARRVSLDLLGLTPTQSEIEEFINDRSPEAYEKYVDRLLAKLEYGERMAVNWLDLARYADTHGYHIDPGRDMWRWRDWIIGAYNKNLPYDQFVIQQLAGDLLPNATTEMKLATGFNRNHPINFEGGAIPEEYQAAYIFDRIDTTATAFMGISFRCAQCHDHKYDPFTNRDYYRFYAYFHNVPENGLDGTKGNAIPFMKAPTDAQSASLKEFDDRIADLDTKVKLRRTEAATQFAAWQTTALERIGAESTLGRGLVAHYVVDETKGKVLPSVTNEVASGMVEGAVKVEQGKVGKALRLDGSNFVNVPNGPALDRTDHFSYGAWVKPVSNDQMTIVSKMDDPNGVRGWDLYLGGGQVFVHLINRWENNAIRVNTKMTVPVEAWSHIFATYDGSGKAAGVRIYVNGVSVDLERTHDSLTQTIKTDKPLHIGRRLSLAPFKGLIEDLRIYDRELTGPEVSLISGLELVRAALQTPTDKRTQAQADSIANYYFDQVDKVSATLAASLSDQKRKRAELESAIPTSMVMNEMEKPRDTFMLVRGQYDHKGDKVTPGTPAVFETTNSRYPANRLGLAMWLTEPNHPLTSRVAVNNMWQMHFGVGLVKTSEEFGSQGERPSHPELLDWLATEFVRTGWDVKAMHRLIVTSATYRQSAKVTSAALTADPENRLLSHAPRVRLNAEFIRDVALDAAGLLVKKVGGPSVKPYHPKGLWEEMAFGGGFSEQTYVQGKGEDLYRRTMYTFWKRTVPPPSLQTFDAPEREFCIVRRSTTNTPLQALVLMNDPTYVEASRKFAERVLRESGATVEAKINFAYRSLLSRSAGAKELKVLGEQYRQSLVRYQRDKAAVDGLLKMGESMVGEGLDRAELAAWTDVCGVLLNLDETITRG